DGPVQRCQELRAVLLPRTARNRRTTGATESDHAPHRISVWYASLTTSPLTSRPRTDPYTHTLCLAWYTRNSILHISPHAEYQGVRSGGLFHIPRDYQITGNTGFSVPA